MTTKTDNYRELTNSPHSWHSDNDRTEDCEICKRNDAIAALIKERDTVAKWRDIFDKQASGLFMECWEQKTNNRILARENERLREALQRAQTDFERIARGVIAPERAADMSAQEIAAALANAPTPNDKGK